MFFFGFLTSSPHCTMISYPSNAMNVNPITMNTSVRSLSSGKMGVKLSMIWTPFASRAYSTANAMKKVRISIWMSVIIEPALPVAPTPA